MHVRNCARLESDGWHGPSKLMITQRLIEDQSGINFYTYTYMYVDIHKFCIRSTTITLVLVVYHNNYILAALV